MNTTNEPTTPSDARCDSCDWTFGCFDGGEPCQKKPKPTDGSAVEWVTMEFRGKDKWDLCANGVLLVKNLTFDVAEAARITLNAQRSELARRADEAECRLSKVVDERDQLKYVFDLNRKGMEEAQQLVDSGSWAGYPLIEAVNTELKACRTQLAAAQAEAAEMRKQRDMAGKQVITLTAEINRLRKGITEIKAGTRIGWFMTDLGAKCEKLLNP